MPAVIAMLVVLLAWALLSGRLARGSVTAAIAMVAAGIALSVGSNPVFEIDLDTKTVERAVEVALAIVLFVDATEVPKGILGPEPRITVRLLAIALPLSLLLAWLAGFALFPEQDAWVLAVLAVVAVPTDLAPAVAIVRDRRVPSRLRSILNVEAGLNDGVVAPLFLFCIAGAETPGRGTPVSDALANALPAVLIALGVGAAVGLAGARLLAGSWARGWTEPAALRFGVLALPLLCYTASVSLDGNGFVAAFIAGVFFNSSAHRLPEDALHLVEDVGSLLTLAVWFAFGQLVTAALRIGFDWEILLYALLALTVVRIAPVTLALARTGIARRDVLFIGWLGPRGLASIVFGLLAFIDLSHPREAAIVVQVMVMVVLASVVLHGLSAGALAAAYGRRSPP
ncbi:MAG: cation:proton antiporter [Solirubrobacteraceae bacterium]